MSRAYFIALVTLSVLACSNAQRRPPNYSLDDMPNTAFDCRDKTIGGYYADPEADCQMFHVCVKTPTDIQDFRFLCPNDTMFDQENQICANWFDIDCEANTLYYAKGFDLLRIGNGPANDDLLQKSPVPERRLPTVVHRTQQRDEQDLFRGSSSSDIHRGRDEEDEEFERQNKKKAKVSVRRKQQNARNRRPIASSTQKPEEVTTFLPETNQPSVPEYTTINRNRNEQRGSTSTPNDFIRNTQRTAAPVQNNFQKNTSPPPQNNNFKINVPSTPPQNNFQRNNFQTPAPTNNDFQNTKTSQQPRNDFQRTQPRNNNFQSPPPAQNNNVPNNHFDVPRTTSRNNNQQRNNNANQQPTQLPLNNNDFQQRNNQQRNNFQNQAPRNQQRNQQREQAQSTPTNFVTSPTPTQFNNQRSTFQSTTFQSSTPLPQTFQQQNFPSSTFLPPFKNQDRNQGFISSSVAPPQFSSSTPAPSRQDFTNEINPSTISPTTYNAFQQRKNNARRNFQSTPLPNNFNNQQRNFQSTVAPFQQSPSSVSPQSFAPEIITTPKPQFFPTTYTPQSYKPRPQGNSPQPFQQRRGSRPRDDFINNEHPDELLKTAPSSGIRASDLNAIQKSSVYPSSTPFPAPSSPRSFTAPRQQSSRPRGQPQQQPTASPFERPRGPPSTPAPFEVKRTQPQQQFDNRRVSSNTPQNFNSQSTPFFNPSTASPNFNTNAAKTNSFFNPSSTQNFNTSPSKTPFFNPSTQAPARQSSQSNFFNPSTAQNFNSPSTFNSPSPNTFNSAPSSTSKPFFNSSPQPQRASSQTQFNPSTAQPFQQTNPDKKSTKPHKKANKDYDYAYYDETPYDEYEGIEHIDEFHKTQNKG